MPKITKLNFKKFARKKLLPNADGSRPSGEAADREFKKMSELLDQFHRDYDSLQTIRDNWDRCDRYLSSDQFSDVIPDPDGCENITEEEYIRKQGMVPLSVNIIAEPVTNIVGLYVRNRLEPLVVARDRDEQKLGEMMTIAMEYAYETHHLHRMNARAYEEFLSSGVGAFRVGYDRDDERNTSDVKVIQCELERMGWDNNTTGMYFENITRVGYLHDMPLLDVLKDYAKSPADRQKIEYIYRDKKNAFNTLQQYDKDRKTHTIDFVHTLNPEHCRVYEIWTKELIEGEEDGWVFHDKGEGIEILTKDFYDPDIIAENNRRILEMVEAGGKPEDASLIEDPIYRCNYKWVVRHLTPEGYVLKEEVSPYAHGSHPFVIGAFQRKGKVHSLVERLINIQRIYNSTLTSNRFIRMNAAKGAGAVNQNVLERSKITKEEFAKVYTDPSAIIELDWEAGEEIFKPFVSQASNLVDEKTPQMCLEIMDRISGNTGAIRGERPAAGTPASLYAQMAENGNNNIADMVEWYNGLIAKRDYKIMMVIQQYYSDKRYITIAGKNYSEQAKWYDPQKVRNSRFDLSLIESQTTGIFRAQNEQTLQFLLQNGLISLKTYLSCSSSFFADKMLEQIKSEEEEAAKQQAAAQQQQQLAMTQQQAVAMQAATAQNQGGAAQMPPRQQ